MKKRRLPPDPTRRSVRVKRVADRFGEYVSYSIVVQPCDNRIQVLRALISSGAFTHMDTGAVSSIIPAIMKEAEQLQECNSLEDGESSSVHVLTHFLSYCMYSYYLLVYHVACFSTIVFACDVTIRHAYVFFKNVYRNGRDWYTIRVDTPVNAAILIIYRSFGYFNFIQPDDKY